jgi:pimeloyl-ACP methyl ester carboxylesterase
MTDGPPSLRQLLGEARFLAEWWAGRNQRYEQEGRDGVRGKTVLVIPGLLAADWMTGPLRRALEAAGYDVHGWALGWNLGLRDGLIDRMLERTGTLAERGGPVALVGWSLGGLYAREIAKRMPDAVDRVVTLGSPFSGDIRANRAWRLYERVAGHSIDTPPIEVCLPGKPPQRTVAVWSRCDGIVSPSTCCGLPGESDERVEVDCTHMGFVCAAPAIEAVIRALA